MHERPKTVSSTRVFEGSVFDARIDRVRFDDGKEQRLDVVEHGPSYAIVATPAPGHLVLVRQYRHAADDFYWELPAGAAEPGEDAADGAARELREETGYRAGRMRPLGALAVSPGYCDETLLFFHADELAPGEQALDGDERIEYATFDVDAAWRLVASARIADMKTVLALLWMESNRGELGGRFGR